MNTNSVRRRRIIPRAHPVSWWMLAITTGAILITAIDRVLLPTVLPGILKEFNLNASQGGLLVSLSFLGSTIGGVVLGVAGDSLGKGPRRAWAWLASVAVVIVAAFATAFSRSLGQLQALRVLMGIGTGSMEPINVAMVGEWWQRENRGFAVGAHHTGFPFGQFLGPLLIGVVVAAASWREVFLFLPLLALPICVLQIVIARRHNLARVNQWIEQQELTPSVTLGEIDAQPKLSNPLLRLWRVLCSDRNVALGVLANFLFLWTEAGVMAFITLQLTQDVGMSLAAAATVSGASGLTGWIGQVFWGTLSDHRGRKFSLSFLAVGSAVAIFAMMFIHDATTAWLILIGWGLFRNSPYPVLYAAMIDTVPEAAASGLGLMVGLGLGLSGMIAAPVAGLLIDHYGFTADYLLLAAISLSTLIPIALLREKPWNDRGAVSHE